VAVPAVVGRIGDKLGADGIEVDVADEFQEIRIPRAHEGFVPPLEDVADGLIAAIVGLGIALMDPLPFTPAVTACPRFYLSFTLT
jgi:hypothetical protein